MIEHLIYYQFGFFAPNTHLQPKPDIIGRLLEAFKDKGFIPTTAQELQQIGPAIKTGLQLQFTSPNREWNLAFEPHRALLKKENVGGTGMGSPEDFCEEANEIFDRLLKVNPFTGTRLSYATKGLLPELNPAKLDEVNKRILNLLPFYTKYPPYQWTTRNVARFDVHLGEMTESLNVITDINRVQGTIARDVGPLSFDRIEIGFDINTYQENTTPRFTTNHVGLFLQEAIKQSQNVMVEIESKLNE
ncbi:MAG: hypothetical protein KJ757_01230 [Planctomycetes bacterium]|nr:hypothetical protein [Planctomycetota bacterium]MBU1518140.1 hypothetical protein [Planctomycetota bacterium]MBU2457737.1 hypothetical protein [Planctomycetota bacterium]MBU2596176.1 hypothetical protein [Planctomycetota bacterium]